MSFPAYPDYQDSGVEWLGEVPSHWTVTGLKRAFSIAGGSTPKSDVEDFWDGDIPWITPGDLSKLSTKFIAHTARRITNSGLASCAASLSPAGSIVISTRAPIGSLAITNIDASTNQGCKTLVVKEGASAAFGYYALSIATEQLNVRGKGSTFLEISADDLGAFELPFPPQSEQVTITAFLNRETAKIDALIEEQRRLIALLKEKRQAVISHAVTKGLDPHTPKKDSGIEWLSEVPAHWELKRLKHLVTDYCDGPFGSGLKSEHYVDKGVRVIRLQNIKEDVFDESDAAFIDEDYFRSSLIRHEVLAGDVLVAGLGDDRNRVGRACVAPSHIGVAMVKADCFRFRLTASHDPYFVAAQLSASSAFVAGKLSSGSTRSRIPASVMAQRSIAVPPLQEQRSITAHLREMSSKFDLLAGSAAAAIVLLNERRAALISAAVTGKIDVRGSAKVLPFSIDRARARGLIGTEIIEQSVHQATFGRVKFQKLAFLAEGHVGISELAGCYTRAAAGPLDGALIDDMERGAHSIAGIAVDQAGGIGTMVSYRLNQQRGTHRQELADWLGPDRTAKLDKLITDFAPLNTKQAEAVATLYGVWNDLLRDDSESFDDEIITGFLNDWHPEKREKFRAGELVEWLGWMRRHGIVPTGSGPKTTTGRLFV